MNEKVLRLMQLAMEISRSGKAHAFCQYSGHTDQITYYAHPKNQEYQGDKRVFLVEHTYFYLTGGAEAKLDAAIAEFESLLMEGAA